MKLFYTSLLALLALTTAQKDLRVRFHEGVHSATENRTTALVCEVVYPSTAIELTRFRLNDRDIASCQSNFRRPTFSDCSTCEGLGADMSCIEYMLVFDAHRDLDNTVIECTSRLRYGNDTFGLSQSYAVTINIVAERDDPGTTTMPTACPPEDPARAEMITTFTAQLESCDEAKVALGIVLGLALLCALVLVAGEVVLCSLLLKVRMVPGA